jgi:DNA (cytosine-5)-methyltransferase 1
VTVNYRAGKTRRTGVRARDTFAGAGGWDVAGDALGWDLDGVENMREARMTRDKNGFVTVLDDVRKVEPVEGEYDVELSGPPCQTFAWCGAGVGRRALDHVLSGIEVYARGDELRHDELAEQAGDERTALVLEPLRIALKGRPVYLAWEQVEPVKAVWDACAPVLRAAGYSVVTGVLRAEQFGVPQTRKRAVLMARRDGFEARLPEPTHARFGDESSLLPAPVSAASLFGWPDGTYMVSNYGTGGDCRKRGKRFSDQPAATMTSKADRIKVHFPDGTVRNLTIAEAARIQTFPEGFVFEGNKTMQGVQVGNAIPSGMALAVLRSLTAR